ncbi:MAG TPA: CheR family methyltransferase [Stenomitos sp.]
MDPNLLDGFIDTISQRTGLRIREQDRITLQRSVSERLKALQIANLSDYLYFLSREEGYEEWRTLARYITTGESYFYRDRGQMTLLSETVLPGLIRAKRAAASSRNHSKPSLRIWSAGCSTGEEAYTMSILLEKLLPDRKDWSISILGTDLNPDAIRKAQQGIYRQWSFRQTPLDYQTRFFTKTTGGWQIHEHLRRDMTFRYGNLLQDVFPNSLGHLHEIDLILCRNVFIYFDSHSIACVLDKFYKTLAPGGFLLCGHAELQGQDVSQFQLLSFPESTVYKRPDGGGTAAKLWLSSPVAASYPSPLDATQSVQSNGYSPSTTPSSENDSAGFEISMLNHATLHLARSPEQQMLTRSPLERPSSQNSARPQSALRLSQPRSTPPSSQPSCQDLELRYVRSCLRQGKAAEALHLAQDLYKRYPEAPWICNILAYTHAALEQYDLAWEQCEKAFQRDPENLYPLYLQAHIAIRTDNLRQAKTLLKKIVYLDPLAWDAYLELSLLYRREHLLPQAHKTAEVARQILVAQNKDNNTKCQAFLMAEKLGYCIGQKLAIIAE